MSERSDRIRISTSNDAQDTRFVGTYIEINNKLYEPEIAPDGAYIKINEAQDVKYGTVKLSESVTELSAGGINGSFTVKPENGIGTLPIGKYQIENWTIRRDDDKGSRWELKGSQNELKGFFDVNEDFETALVEVGEPVITTVTASYRDGSYSFNQQIKGRDGEGISLMRNGSRPQAPQLNIKNKDGTYDRTYSFSYG